MPKDIDRKQLKELESLYGSEAVSKLLNGKESIEDVKFIDKKLKNLKKQGYKDAERIQMLFLDLMVFGMDIDDNIGDRTTDGRRFIQHDAYDYECKLLRAVARNPAVAPIMDFMRQELLAFARPGTEKKEGFRIVKRGNQKPDAEEEKVLQELTGKLIDKYFYTMDSPQPNFAAVLSAAFEEAFVLNRNTFFIEEDRTGRPLSRTLIDSSRIREAYDDRFVRRFDNEEYEELLLKNKKEVKFEVEYYLKNTLQGKLREIKLPKTKISTRKYLHTVDPTQITTVNSLLTRTLTNALDLLAARNYNKSFISNNRTPTGIITFEGAQDLIGANTFKSFKHQLWSYLQNPKNRSRLPIAALPMGAKANYLQLQNNARDVMYYEWMSYLITLICAQIGIQPESLGLPSHKSMMERGGLTKAETSGIHRISKSHGRNGFLKWFVEVLNTGNDLERLTGRKDLQWEVTGIEVVDDIAKAEVIQKKLTTNYSMNEIRREDGLEILDTETYPWAEIPGIQNPQIANLFSQSQQQKMQEEQMKQQQMLGGGMPGMDFGGGLDYDDGEETKGAFGLPPEAAESLNEENEDVPAYDEELEDDFEDADIDNMPNIDSEEYQQWVESRRKKQAEKDSREIKKSIQIDIDL